MIKQPEKIFRFTDEEADGIMYFLHMHAMQDDPNACYLAAKLHKQQNYNPADVQQLLHETVVIKTTQDK